MFRTMSNICENTYFSPSQEVTARHDAVLTMYGEKAEEAEELRLDLEDVKTMYRQQVLRSAARIKVGFGNRSLGLLLCAKHKSACVRRNTHMPIAGLF